MPLDPFDDVSEFIEAFPNPPTLISSKSGGPPWVFRSQSVNGSSSVDVGTPMNIIHDQIISALTNYKWRGLFVQFWAPVTMDDGRLLLSSSGQPFSVTNLFKDFVMYRLDSEKHQYNIDVNMGDIEGDDPMITSGGPATAFLNRLPCIKLKHGFSLEDEGYYSSLMLPICFPSERNNCLGVLQLFILYTIFRLQDCVLYQIEAIKKAGLDVYNVQEQIPYDSISGLKLAKEEIEEALKVVCESHNLALAQAWIACEDKSHVQLSSSLEDNKTMRLLAVKMTGYYNAEYDDYNLKGYSDLCDLTPRTIQGELPLETLQDYKSRYFTNICPTIMQVFSDKNRTFTIRLKNIDTGDFDYAFEFIWFKLTKRSNQVTFLEALLLTLKGCLPRFKFASGVDLGDELDVIVNKTKKIKIFKGKRPSPMSKAQEEGKKPVLVDYIARSKVMMCKTTPKVLPLEDTETQFDLTSVESPTRGETSNINKPQEKGFSPILKALEDGKESIMKCKTAEIILTREDIEKQFDKTMKEAAENLTVSLSTLKRKLRKLGILEWPRTKPMKRNKNDLPSNQIETNEQDNGAAQKPLTFNVNDETLTIKAEYADDMIKIRLPILQATYLNVEKIIGMKFNLSLGTYKLKYRDEVGDLILLTSEEDMSCCIDSSRKVNPNEVRLSVLPSTQPIPVTNIWS